MHTHHAQQPAAQRLQSMLNARFGVALDLGDALAVLDQANRLQAMDEASRLQAMFEQDGLGEHPVFRQEVWNYSRTMGDTNERYWAWVAQQYDEMGMMLPWDKYDHPAVLRAQSAGLTVMHKEPEGWFVTSPGVDAPVEGTPFFNQELAAWINADDHIAQSVRRLHGLSPRGWRALPLDDQMERIQEAMTG